jgi:hypothetical protein
MKREPQSTVAKEAAGESEFRLASASLLPMAPQITFITTMISIQKIKQASSHNEEYISDSFPICSFQSSEGLLQKNRLPLQIVVRG